MRYQFIVLEGGDCVGKSTTACHLREILNERGQEVVLTREPGGSTGAEDIRKLLLEGGADRWDREAELLLFYAARSDHLTKVILPALKKDKVIITDRFDLSTWAFQAEPQEDLHNPFEYLHHRVVKKLEPWREVSKGILFDAPVDIVLERMGSRTGGKDRMEGVDKKTLSRRRDAYLEKARSGFFPGYEIIDASKTHDEVFKEVLASLEL